VNLVLLEPSEVFQHSGVELSGPRAAHLIDVLRVVPGQTVRVGVIDGPVGVGTVRVVADKRVVVDCAFESGSAPRPGVDLLLALPRPKVMRRMWAQLSALGVSRIILTNAEKVERPYFDTHFLQPECYRPLLLEGLQQARDTALPTVTIHRRFKVLVEDDLGGLSDAGLRLVADPSGTRGLSDVVRSRPGDSTPTRVLLAIGPEGGWNSFELALLDAHGFERVSMGPRILRTDTACLALLALVHDALTPSRG
jgi:16S rRNA (uracil1498-N3)-methyltransferase